MFNFFTGKLYLTAVATLLTLITACTTPSANHTNNTAPQSSIERWCRLDALSDADRTRREELLHELKSMRTTVKENEDGMTFHYRADNKVLPRAAEWAGLERLCCPFLSFEMGWNENETPWLRIRGERGIQDFLKQRMDLMPG